MAANGEKIPIKFELGDRLIDGAVVKPLSFQSYSEFYTEALNMRQPKSFSGRIQRLRLQRQVSYYVNGSTANVSMDDLLKMPIHSARKIIARLDDNEGVAGKIIKPGDGIDKSVVYELGTSIPIQNKPPIKELEFLAKTYGDLEDILAAGDQIQQTMMLISTIAKPLGGTLSTLPSWASSMITMADGVTILRQVLPLFIESPEES
jgi:hypothetical protein